MKFYTYSAFSTMFPRQIKFGWLQQVQSYTVLARLLSDFRTFTNVCTINLYNVITMNTKLRLMTSWLLSDVIFQKNKNSLNKFMVITKTTEYGQVEANQHDISSSLYRERKAIKQTYFITQKSLGGHAKTSVTSPLLKTIKFYSIGKFKRQ